VLIPHDIIGHWGAGRVVLRPAAPGTGVIAGGPVRAVLEAAGIKDVLTKCLGTANAHNVAKATVVGLKSLKTAREVSARRQISVAHLFGLEESAGEAAPSTPAAPSFAITRRAASFRFRRDQTLSQSVCHRPPLTPFSSVVNIRSVQTHGFAQSLTDPGSPAGVAANGTVTGS